MLNILSKMNKIIFPMICMILILSCSKKNAYILKLQNTSGYKIERSGDKITFLRCNEPREYAEVWHKRNNRYYDVDDKLTMALIKDTTYITRIPGYFKYFTTRIYMRNKNEYIYERYQCFSNSIGAVLDFSISYDSCYNIKTIETYTINTYSRAY